MDAAFPGVPAAEVVSESLPAPKSQVSVLPNGVKVVSQETYGQGATVGVFVEAGARFEDASNSGTSYMLQNMAYKSTSTRTHFRMVRDIESVGATAVCVAARDSIMYQMDGLRDSAPQMLNLLHDNLANSMYLDHELLEQQQDYPRRLAELESNPEQLMTELLHEAAYESNSLGNPQMPREGSIRKLTSAHLRNFVAQHFTADRIVLSGAGVDHAEFLEKAKALFGNMPAPATKFTRPPKAKYTGGETRLKGDSDNVHVAIAFEAPGWLDHKALLPLCVLHMLMGGGNSFSAGGPGKGMYSRNYLNALNKHAWLDSCTQFNAFYNDSGLFGIHGSAPHDKGAELTDVLVQQLKGMTSTLDAQELNRAKNQLKSSVFYNLESRVVLFEDLGRQVLTFGTHTGPAEEVKKIDKITAEDVMKAAKMVLSSNPTVVALGEISSVPRFETIAKKLK
eukprot:GILK01001452.1.p1 GENE.GILK01001452.1~~GILK01001452.1.p1  ORF type:complete len:518 (-),score=76.55 GILK01001452.1:181-1533(-)